MYYLKNQAASKAVQFMFKKQVPKEVEPVIQDVDELNGQVCIMEEGCVTCSAYCK